MLGFGWLERIWRRRHEQRPSWATAPTDEQPTINPWATTADGNRTAAAPKSEARDNRSPRFRDCGTDWPPNRR